MLRVVILSSAADTSIYVANRLIKDTNVVGVIKEVPAEKTRSERLGWKLKRTAKYGFFKVFDETLYAKYYSIFQAQRDHQDMLQYLFPAKSEKGIDFLGAPEICEVDNINSVKTLESLRRLNPDVAVVCGTSILKPRIFKVPKQGTINMHCGFTPEYRGFGNFWALYNDEPQKVGVTIHFVDEGIDTGAVIFQERVIFDYQKDSLARLYYKCHICAAELLIKSISLLEKGSLTILNKNTIENHFYTQFGLSEYIRFCLRINRRKK